MRVVRKLDEALGSEFVRDALHRLAGEPHVARDMGDGQRAFIDGTHDLPARACQTETGAKLIAGRQQPAVKPEGLDDQPCERRAGGSVESVVHEGSLAY